MAPPRHLTQGEMMLRALALGVAGLAVVPVLAFLALVVWAGLADECLGLGLPGCEMTAGFYARETFLPGFVAGVALSLVLDLRRARD